MALLVSGMFALVSHGTTAYALQPRAPIDWSWYVRTTNYSTLYSDGRSQGQYDASFNPPKDSKVILDFGGQNCNNTGTNLTDGANTNISYAQMENLTEEYIYGYIDGLGADYTSHLNLSIGTNNSNCYVNSTGGATWEQETNNIINWVRANSYASQVRISAANDMEPGWNTQSNTIAWVNGYSCIPSCGKSTAPPYYNFGCACGASWTDHNNSSFNQGAGCPYNRQPCYTWNQYGLWYISWYQIPSYPLPEIYFNCCWTNNGYPVNANQWEQLALYGLQSQSWDGLMQFVAPLDEQDMPGASGEDGPNDSWNQLWTALNYNGSTAQNLLYSMEIHQAT